MEAQRFLSKNRTAANVASSLTKEKLFPSQLANKQSLLKLKCFPQKLTGLATPTFQSLTHSQHDEELFQKKAKPPDISACHSTTLYQVKKTARTEWEQIWQTQLSFR